MRLTMKQRQAVTAVTVQRYRQGSKKVKQQILDEFCETTGYCRGYARYVLRNHGRQVWLSGKRTIVGDVGKRQQRLKPKYYDEQVLQELLKLWQLLNYVCGKRLVCYVEQKNYSVVRQTVGYQRFDTAAELMVLKQLYATLRLYTNFFQPTMKLKSKERLGSRVKKSYHAPQTPYQRLLSCAEVTAADKKKLQRQYRLLNPAALKRELDKQRQELFRLAGKKRPLKLKRHLNQRGLQIKPHVTT
jgi:hypothetical protein